MKFLVVFLSEKKLLAVLFEFFFAGQYLVQLVNEQMPSGSCLFLLSLLTAVSQVLPQIPNPLSLPLIPVLTLELQPDRQCKGP